MAIELLSDGVRYQAKTKIKDLALETAKTKNLSKVTEEVSLGAKIFKFCQALDFGDYIAKAERDKIVRTLVYLAGINELPVAPYLGNIKPPTISSQGAKGAKGDTGDTGPEGGGVPISATSVSIDTICDRFPISDSRGVEYTLNIYDGSNMRVMRIQGGWSADGSDYADDGGIGTTITGDTSGISMSIIVSGSTVQLFATVTSGTWTVEGTRKYVPNNGNGIVNPTTLSSGKVWVGNASNSPTAVTPSGDVTISTTGVTAISSGVIVNNDVSSSAGIGVSKLESLTASKAVVTNSSGVLTASTATATEVGYLSGLESNLQDQLDSKIDSASGAISTVVDTNLTASRALISNPSGKIAVSSVTSTELGALSGIDSNVQDQIDSTVQVDDSITLRKKVVEIGSWNMSGDNVKNVAHGITDHRKIRSVDVIIQFDADFGDDETNSRFPLSHISSSGLVSGWVDAIGSTKITLERADGGTFDTTSFDDTSGSRGWVTITYEA